MNSKNIDSSKDFDYERGTIMSSLTFPLVVSEIRKHMLSDVSQYELVSDLFDAYLVENNKELDCSQTSRWYTGKRDVPGAIQRYYLDYDNYRYMVDAVRERVLPYVSDAWRMSKELGYLIEDDDDMSEELKKDFEFLLAGYAWPDEVIAKMIIYAMQQNKSKISPITVSWRDNLDMFNHG